MYRHIVVPLDGSSYAEHALPLARAIAHRAGALLHLVLVHTPLPPHTADLSTTTYLQRWQDQYRAREEDYLQRTADGLTRRGVQAVPEWLEGEVGTRLTERVEGEADLVVMTTHARTGLDRAWLGSVAEDVLHHVHKPVVVLRPTDAPVPAQPELRRILVAVDGSPASDAALDEAAALAGLFGGRLVVTSVAATRTGLTSPYIPHAAEMNRSEVESRDAEAHALVERALGRLSGDVPAVGTVQSDFNAARGIFRALAGESYDLVAVGTHRRHRLARVVLGSTADKVVRGSLVPVLVRHASG